MGVPMSEVVQRRRNLVRVLAPTAGLLAAGLLVWQGSYAAFSATTQDTRNTWSVGNHDRWSTTAAPLTYAATTTAAFGGASLKPGSTGTTCLTVKSTGTAAGTWRCTRARWPTAARRWVHRSNSPLPRVCPRPMCRQTAPASRRRV